MNIFVLCTGRCGSTTFIRACQHISNFSSTHESLSGKLGEQRFSYPERHIEADNRLSWLLGRLDMCYGKRAFYVHLLRDMEKTARSFTKRADRGIMKAYQDPGILMKLPKNSDPMKVAYDYIHTVTSNIEMFLRDKPLQMRFDLESANQLFPMFCERISAQVDLLGALGEFAIHHNASPVDDVSAK